MTRHPRLRRILRSERGSVIPLVCVMMMALLGMLAFAVDIGNAYLHKRRLQAAVDLALVSAAQRLPNGAIAVSDSHRYVDANWAKRDPSKVTSDAWTECTTPPDPVTGCTKPDLLHVQATVEVPTFFAKLFGVKQWKIKAKGSACGPCDTSSKKFDVMVVLDRSYSMCLSSTGAPNGCADINNARDGIKSLLGFFNPQFDRVGLTLLSSSDDANPNSFHVGGTPPCDSADILDGYAGKGMFYRTLGDFMDGTPTNHDSWVVSPLASDFKNSDGSLNTSSTMVSTLNCLQHKYWTPIAPAVSEATNALIAGRPDAQKILVFMGDGGANVQPMQRDADGHVVTVNGVQQPSWYTASPGNDLHPCHDAVGQANRAKNAGIEVYTIGYDLNAGGAQTCYIDNTQSGSTVEQGIDARETMRQMATDDEHFYEKAAAGQVYTIFEKIGREIVGTGVRLTD